MGRGGLYLVKTAGIKFWKFLVALERHDRSHVIERLVTTISINLRWKETTENKPARRLL